MKIEWCDQLACNRLSLRAATADDCDFDPMQRFHYGLHEINLQKEQMRVKHEMFYDKDYLFCI